MSLSNIVKTHELEPILFTPSRAEFRIPADKIYLQNLRLSNLGLTTTSTVGSNAPLSYAYNVGAFQIIKNIFLYHNNQMLAQIKGVDEWMAFQNLLYSNEENMDKVNLVVKTTMGFEFNSVDGKIEVPAQVSNISSAHAVKQPSLLSLSKILSFLDQVGYLNTNVMRQLRLVIDFNTLSPSHLNYDPQVPNTVSKANPAVVTFASDASALGFAVGQTVTGNGFVGTGWVGLNADLPITNVTGNTITITINSTGFTNATPTTMGAFIIKNYNSAVTLAINRPYLLLDELHNANPAQYPMRPITYGSIESQSITVSANATSVSQRLNAWNNKKLLRLLMVNQDNGSTDLGIKKYQSLGMYNESWKFWANGEQLIPNQGISTDALKQCYLVDAWGKSSNINIPQGASDVRNQLNNSYLFHQSSADSVRNSNFCGNLSYGGLRVADAIDGQSINKLDLTYTREAYPDTPNGNVVRTQSQEAFTMVLYGEVQKQLMISNGEVVVVG
jgi:hypothetical protein